MNTHKSRYRIKSRFRFTAFIVTVMILFVSMSNIALGFSDVSSMTKPNYTEVQISSGDTLWEIATLYNPDGNDIRRFVFDICELNQISADAIYPGQIILVPIFS